MFYYNSLLDGSIPMQQQQHQTNKIYTEFFLDRCQFGWSYFPVWIYCSLNHWHVCVWCVRVFKRWMRDKRPRLLLLFRLFDWLLTKERHSKLGITCCVYYQPTSLDRTYLYAHTASSLPCWAKQRLDFSNPRYY